MQEQPRIAVCISGQPRVAKETFHLIMNNIIRPNNADVFIHMNYDIDYLYMEKSHADKGKCQLESGIDQWVIGNYQPKRWLVEKPRDYKNDVIGISEKRLENHKRMNAHKGWTDEQHKKYIVRQMYNMYYSIYKANELKEIYMLETGQRYDYVFRIRFDITPKEVILARDYDPNFIYKMDFINIINTNKLFIPVTINATTDKIKSLQISTKHANGIDIIFDKSYKIKKVFKKKVVKKKIFKKRLTKKNKPTFKKKIKFKRRIKQSFGKRKTLRRSECKL